MSRLKPPYRIPELMVFQKAKRMAVERGHSEQQATKFGHQAVSGNAAMPRSTETVLPPRQPFMRYTTAENDW